MSILFSRECEYALQAVSYLALKPAGELTSIKDLTKKLRIPYHFLAKILQRLVGKGLLISQKGPSGGFGLATSAESITLFHVVDAVDGSDFLHRCVMGFPECSGKHPCAVHATWGNLRENVYQMLVNQSIAQTAQSMRKPEYRD